jgi:RES domain-containing protein
MLTVWRIVNHKHLKTAFTGEGARLYGGRWNSAGTAMIYMAQSQSLAALELLVHLDSPTLLEKYLLIPIEVDSDLIMTLEASRLPANWRSQPVPPSTQAIGDAWVVERKSVVLSVPSVLVPDERNYLLNPKHPEFERLPIGQPVAFQFDPRFEKKRR